MENRNAGMIESGPDQWSISFLAEENAHAPHSISGVVATQVCPYCNSLSFIGIVATRKGQDDQCLCCFPHCVAAAEKSDLEDRATEKVRGQVASQEAAQKLKDSNTDEQHNFR